MVRIADVLSHFPAPTFRKYQKEVLEKVTEHFNAGKKVILLEAPTGLGKSMINATYCGMWKSFYATPQLALIDQICRDRFLSGTFVEIKGRQNYDCVHDPAATVDIGLCARMEGFQCDRFEVCPYWIQKMKALEANSAIMSFAYFILEGRTITDFSFGNRDLLVLDEAHSLDAHIISHVNVEISPFSLEYDLYKMVEGSISKETSDLTDIKITISAILRYIEAKLQRYTQMTLLGEPISREECKENNKLENWRSGAEMFLETCDKTEWVWQYGWTSYRGKSHRTLTAQPLYARLFGKELIWNRANKFIISSATILDPNNYVKQVGIDLSVDFDKIAHIRVPSSFPVENRPIIDVVNGKLTYKKKAENFDWATEILEKVLDVEEGRNVAVHCVSYSNASEIYETIKTKYRDRMIVQTPRTRRTDLDEWLSDRGKVFLSVAYTEGQDWAGDLCEAQVLFKVPYMNISDKRVARRLEYKDWKWYRLEALKQAIQAYGRAVRSETDKARFYVIDKSFVELLRMTRKDIPGWFSEALPEEWKKVVGVS